MYGKDGSFHSIFYVVLPPPLDHTRSYRWFYVLGVGTPCIPEAFFCICLPYSPFQNCETWLTLFSSAVFSYVPVSILSTKFPGLGVVVTNSRLKDLRSTSPLLNLRDTYSRKSGISRENYSCYFVTDNIMLKTTQWITSIMRERRACKLHEFCKFLCCPADY